MSTVLSRARVIKALVWSGVLLVLLLTLRLYNQPDFLVNLADQLWSCF